MINRNTTCLKMSFLRKVGCCSKSIDFSGKVKVLGYPFSPPSNFFSFCTVAFANVDLRKRERSEVSTLKRNGSNSFSFVCIQAKKIEKPIHIIELWAGAWRPDVATFLDKRLEQQREVIPKVTQNTDLEASEENE